MKSNLNIRSNLYVMPNDLMCYVSEFSDEHNNFICQIRDIETMEKIPPNRRTYNRFGLCSSHPFDKKATFGPIKKGNEIVYGCRCDVRDTCDNRRKSRQNCMNCSRNID